MGALSFTGKYILYFFIWLDNSPIGGFLVGVALLYVFYKFADYLSTELHRLVTKFYNRRVK